VVLGAGLLAGAVMHPGGTAFAVTYTLLSPTIPICLNNVTQAKLVLERIADSKSK
jgi:hypothetical protein